MKTVYLSMGSNIGDRAANLRAAIRELPAAGIEVLRVSPVYETEPVGYTEQAWFLNLVVECQTLLFPLQLLSRTARIENQLGRMRSAPKGPRTIDIDILLYGSAVIETARLQVPHPRLTERRFVLVPLAQLTPELRHPVLRRSVRELLHTAPQQACRPYSSSDSFY